MYFIKCSLIVVSFFVASLVQAEPGATNNPVQTAKEKAVKALVEKKFQAIERMAELKIESVKASPIAGVYGVKTSGANFWFSEDGNHFIFGDIYQLKGSEVVNLTEEQRLADMQKLNPVRKEKIAKLDQKSFLTFPAKNYKKASITVATDIDCGYCRKLHQEVSKLNEYGVEVRYVAFPRSGKDTASYHKIVAAWCAKNPQEAMTKAKAGEEIPMISCDKSKFVDAHLALVDDLGLRGTPAIILEDGRLLPGYMPADALAMELGIIAKSGSVDGTAEDVAEAPE